MSAILWSWAVSAVVLIALAVLIGWVVRLDAEDHRPKPRWLGILVDGRGRFSLNRTQVVLWSIVVISLVSGVFFGRLIDDVAEPLEFKIPGNVLGLLGISIGTAVTVGAVKSTKSKSAEQDAEAKKVKAAKAGVALDATRAAAALATFQETSRKPFLGQIFMAEEGELADDVVDVTKFQSFGFTVVLLVAYVAMAIHTIVEAKSAAAVTTLPDLKGTFLILLGISYAGYGGGKLPPQAGTPRVVN